MTDKQTRFVEEYCVDFNATQAAIRAKYPKNSASEVGYENLRKPQIAKAVEKRLNELSMASEEVLRRLSQHAESAQMQYLRANGTVDLEGLMGAGLNHLVKGTKHNAQGKLIVEFYDAQTALKELARIRGMITERIEAKLEFFQVEMPKPTD